ncbi:MAG: hypothetical protein sL5_05540 [Candidatus Mesenet longicola]|uniref:Uncharacterized protein n=1 Tax=Candidatus Mesenet longicola TaxID=1892558 RepID=A0A8J3HWH3_9RICK|nr:MAG: hypothetical protein sGL2_05470 [Candidatus Mesenet longicola]GHM59561.1 MAG: hypothetical protein sL5_05540 [Candidatus Mesenet longicola]
MIPNIPDSIKKVGIELGSINKPLVKKNFTSPHPNASLFRAAVSENFKVIEIKNNMRADNRY